MSEAYERLDSFTLQDLPIGREGQEAAREEANQPLHCLVKFDAIEYLSNQNATEICRCMVAKKKPQWPDGIVQGLTLWDEINKPA